MAHRKENDVMSERFSHIKDNVLTMEIEWEHVKSSWELYKREFELRQGVSWCDELSSIGGHKLKCFFRTLQPF